MNQISTPSAFDAPNVVPTSVEVKEEYFLNAFNAREINDACTKGNLNCKIKNFFNTLFTLGITNDIPFREAKLMRFTNMLSVMIVIGILLYIPYSLISGSYVLAAIETIDAAMVASALWFAHKKHFNASKFILIGMVDMFIYINACYIGHESNVQHFYVLINIVPFLVFRLNQYKHILFSVAMTISFFVFYQLTYHYWIPYNLPIEIQRGTNNIGTWLDFVLFAAGIYLLAKNNFDIEEELAASFVTLKSQAIELKRSNEDLEQFAYIISHDLRVPLRNIINFLTLLERRHSNDLSKEGKEFINFSVSGSKRMERLIEDMLAYSRMGRNLPPPQPVDVNEVLKTIQFEMKDKALRPNQKITVEGTMPTLHDVHSTMIYHVLQNLITNGLKFNKNQSPEVVVKVQESNAYYTFSVTDNGIGIPMEFKNKLFQMFKRLHSDSEFQGTGIGLAICKKIVNFYDGEIWFESETGKGTSFIFTLPKK